MVSGGFLDVTDRGRRNLLRQSIAYWSDRLRDQRIGLPCTDWLQYTRAATPARWIILQAASVGDTQPGDYLPWIVYTRDAVTYWNEHKTTPSCWKYTGLSERNSPHSDVHFIPAKKKPVSPNIVSTIFGVTQLATKSTPSHVTSGLLSSRVTIIGSVTQCQI